ncbi:hypothetical protein HKX48_007111 [Thoreauomyces humboldtii]|nr:hypothetical protein HKX48_007111 [Thoreauomyces humboldtii]
MVTGIDEEWQRIVIPIGAVLASWILHTIIFFFAKVAAAKTPWPFDDDLVSFSKWPWFCLLPVIAILIAMPRINIDPNVYTDLHRGMSVLLIIAIGYYAGNMVRLAATVLLRTHNVDSENNLTARIAHTQIQVFKRLCYGFIAIICAACIVFTFPTAWQIGASLLASAGVMGIILGIAAKPMVENSLSSFIIAITRPVLLDDEVVIDGEYGRVEAIQSMFIVVRTWDARRLIIPLSRIFSSTFENWSRRSPWKIGTAFLYLDPSVPVAEVRALFNDHVLPTSGGLWDGKVANCAVTDVTTDGWLQIRFLASAKDPSAAFDLRCHIREKVIEGISKRWPFGLCRSRVQVTGDPWPASMERTDSGKDTKDHIAAPKEPLRNMPLSVARPLSEETSLGSSEIPPPRDYFRGLASGELDGGGHTGDGGHHGF